MWSYYRSDDIVNKVRNLVRISKEIDNKAFYEGCIGRNNQLFANNLHGKSKRILNEQPH